MSIRFTCSCGKALQCRDELAGRKTKCPGCGSVSLVPSKPDDVAAVEPSGDLIPFAFQKEEPRACPRCGMTISPKDILCMPCGIDIRTGQAASREKLSSQSEQLFPSKTCPTCGAEISGADRACPYCLKAATALAGANFEMEAKDQRSGRKRRARQQLLTPISDSFDCRLRTHTAGRFSIPTMLAGIIGVNSNQVVFAVSRGPKEHELLVANRSDVVSIRFRELSKGERALRLLRSLAFLGVQYVLAIALLPIAFFLFRGDFQLGEVTLEQAFYVLALIFVGGPALGLIFWLFGVWVTIRGEVTEFTFQIKNWGPLWAWIPTSKADWAHTRLLAWGLKPATADSEPQ